MGRVHQCEVSYTDPEGIRHSVQVTAESLYEAAVLGIEALRACPVRSGDVGLGATLEVEVYQSLTRHSLPVTRLKRWLEGSGKTPAEQVLKKRLRELFSGEREAGPAR